MPTPVTHAFIALAVGKTAVGRKVPRDFWALLAILAILPDFDTIGLRLGVPYESFWGHRGFFHSLAFAAIASFAAAWLTRRRLADAFKTLWGLWAVLLAAMAVHPLADAMTNGGLGVALLSPLDNGRYFLPWTPIEVSPIGLRGFLTPRGLAVIANEALLIWLPMTALAIAATGLRWAWRRRARAARR